MAISSSVSSSGQPQVLLQLTSLTVVSVEAFADNFSSSVERARDSIVEGYYEAKDRYNRYRNKLTEETNDLLDEIEGND